jgi:hypothetical protein
MNHGTGSCLPARQGSGAATCPTAPDPPPCSGGLQCCHVPHGFRLHLTAWEGFGAATCSTALDPTSLLERAPALSRAPQLWTPPPCSGGLRRCHCGSLLAADLKNKKGLASLPMRLGSHVFKVHPHVFETSDT